MRKVILYICCSLDGFIIRQGVEPNLCRNEREDYGYNTICERVDTVIMGRGTYEGLMSCAEKFPHADKNTYIITREMRQREGLTRFYADDPKELVSKLKMKGGKDIMVDGGSEVVRMMFRDDLLDELIITIVPLIIGSGIRLFGDRIQGVGLELMESKTFDSGTVQLVYKIKKNKIYQKTG